MIWHPLFLRDGLRIASVVAVFLLVAANFAVASESLSDASRKKLDQNWRLCLLKKKGPFSANTCVCKDGSKEMVRKVDGKLILPCGGAFAWCEAFRSDWGRAVAEEGVWVGNLFKRDVYEWKQIGDPHALVRGYALEHFFIAANPGHKLDQLRAYGGLSGAEYEAAALPELLDLYLSQPDFDPNEHYLVVFEMLRRFRVENDFEKILRVRNQSSAIQAKDRGFKPYRDRTHNQISASLVPILRTYREGLPEGSSLAPKVDELILGVEELVTPTDADLRAAVASLDSGATKVELSDALSGLDLGGEKRADALARVLVVTRRAFAESAQRRRLLEVGVDAAGLLRAEIASSSPHERSRLARRTAVDAAFGAGLIDEAGYDDLRSEVRDGRDDAVHRLSERATANVNAAYESVLPAWRHVAPSIDGFAGDVVQSSPVGSID